MVKAWPSNVGGAGLIPDWGPKVPCASGAEKPKYKKYCDKFNKEFKNGPPQKKKKKKRLPWWLKRIRLPMQDPCSRKIPHATEQINLCASATEPVSRARHTTLSPHPRALLHSKGCQRSEKPEHGH